MNEMTILRRLGNSAPPSVPERERARSVLLAAMSRQPARPWPVQLPVGRFRRAALLAVAALIVVGMVSAVGAGIFTEWGPVDHPATEAQVRAEIAETEAAHPLPPGEVYPDLFPTYAAPNNYAQYLGVQTVEFYAMCSWSHYWLNGYEADSRTQMAAALPVIEGFPKWQLIADPRLADDSIRDQMSEVVTGVRADNPGPITTLIQGACQAWP
jgi:hypothetical protein